MISLLTSGSHPTPFFVGVEVGLDAHINISTITTGDVTKMTLKHVSVENVGSERKLELVSSGTNESDRLTLGVHRIIRSIDDIDTLDSWEESHHLVLDWKVFAATNWLAEELLLLEDFDLQPLLGHVYCGGEATRAPSDNDHIVFTAGQADRSAIGGDGSRWLRDLCIWKRRSGRS